MSRIQTLYDMTKQLERLLDQPIHNTNREAIIKEVNELIEERGEYMNQLTPPYTHEEKMIGQKIVILNESIQQKMNKLFSELKGEMQQMKKQKKSNQSYTNPYNKVNSMDGMFLDNKL